MDYTTYTGIRSAVQEELNRSDATDALVASFIRIAEMRCYRSLRVPSMEVKETVFVLPPAAGETEGSAFFFTPARWAETITLTDTSGRPVEYVSQQYFRGLDHSTGDRPVYFTREGDKFLVWPAPGDSSGSGACPGSGYDRLVLYYFRTPQAGNASTNNSPSIYQDVGEAIFFGAVSEGWRYFRENEKYLYYRELFAEVLGQLQEQHDQGDISGATLISKNPYI